MGFNSGFKGLILPHLLTLYGTTKEPKTHIRYFQLDVRGSVHHGIIHKEITNKMQQCIRIYYSTFI